MTLSAVSNKTWLNVEVTLNSWNRVECRIASAGTAVHGSTQLNGNSIGIRKRLACTRVSYVNFARNTEGETYREQAPARDDIQRLYESDDFPLQRRLSE